MIKDTFDLVCLILCIVGSALAVYQLYLCDWNLEKLLFKEDE